MYDLFTTVGNIILCFVALLNAQKIFKVHRAPAVGFFLVACSAGLSVLPSCPLLLSVRADLQWIAEVLSPAMVAFGFLWLSDDHSTAYTLLTGSALLSTLTDWLSRDGLTVMSRCMALSSLSCSLTVCLFAGNMLGVFGSVALSLPAIVALNSTSPLLSPEVAGGILKSVLIGSTTVGCWSIRHSLEKYLQDLKGWERNDILS